MTSLVSDIELSKESDTQYLFMALIFRLLFYILKSSWLYSRGMRAELCEYVSDAYITM